METLKNWIKSLLTILSQKDKLYLLVINFLIVLFLGVLFNPAIGLGVALIASIGKETYDEYISTDSGWNWNDLLIDIIGMVLGLFIIL